MSTNTPKMNLILPTIGVDSGLTWEQAVNSNSLTLDQHNHSPGSGVAIGASSINLTSDLAINDNNLTLIRSVRFNPQSASLVGASDLGCLYVVTVSGNSELYYRDSSNPGFPITSAGSVVATSSGISSGTATASFVASTLVVNSASNTPANIQGASILIGNTGVSGSKFVTLSPVGSLGANYSLTLPALPAQTNVMTLSTSGSISSTTWDDVGQNMGTTGADAIGVSMDSTGSNAVANSRTRAVGSVVGVGGVAVASQAGTFSTPSGSFTTVNSLSVTITTSGRPVFLAVVPDPSFPNNFGITGGASGGFLQFINGATTLGPAVIATSGRLVDVVQIDFPSAGTHTYQFQLAGNTTSCSWARLIAYEL